MKLKSLICSILITSGLALATQSSYAQTATPASTLTPKLTPTPTDDTAINKTVQSLKEKIEDKVEQMNKKSRKVIKGTISKLKDSTLELKTESDVAYTVTLDDTVTSIQTASIEDTEELTVSDLEVDDYILVTGPLIENQISANIIYKQTQYIVIQGQITAVEKASFSIDVLTLEKDTYSIEVEDSTKQVLMNSKTLALEKSGFSKFQVGDNIHAVIIKPAKDSTSARAIRTLIIPQEYFSTL